MHVWIRVCTVNNTCFMVTSHMGEYKKHVGKQHGLLSSEHTGQHTRTDGRTDRQMLRVKVVVSLMNELHKRLHLIPPPSETSVCADKSYRDALQRNNRLRECRSNSDCTDPDESVNSCITSAATFTQNSSTCQVWSLSLQCVSYL